MGNKKVILELPGDTSTAELFSAVQGLGLCISEITTAESHTTYVAERLEALMVSTTATATATLDRHMPHFAKQGRGALLNVVEID